MKYYNQFNLSYKLAETITNIINQKEETNYICDVIKCIVPEHTETVFISPLEKYFNRGGHNISKAKIKKIK